jgi:hypothetical protein
MTTGFDMTGIASIKCIIVGKDASNIKPASRWYTMAIFTYVTRGGMHSGSTVASDASANHFIVIEWRNKG